VTASRAAGIRQAQVARQLGVSRQSASDWHARWQAGGTDAPLSRGPTGPTPRLSDRQLGQVEQVLLAGATANGFVGELWTLDRITSVIQRLTGNGPEVLLMICRLGGWCSTISQVYSYGRPPERPLVCTLVPTPIGSGEVSSSLSTLSSQRGRLRASATIAKTSSAGRAMRTATLLVNTGPPVDKAKVAVDEDGDHSHVGSSPSGSRTTQPCSDGSLRPDSPRFG
jgi:Winged helix-turn helix